MRAARLVHVDRELAERHYAEHAEKPFFGELVEFITSGPTLALVLEGESAISVVRTTMGSTNPTDSPPGTIRGDLALAMPDNLVHGSDSPESAQREIELWFPDGLAERRRARNREPGPRRTRSTPTPERRGVGEGGDRLGRVWRSRSRRWGCSATSPART